MKDAAVDFGAISETTVFLDFFKNLPDPRQPGKVVYPLDDSRLLGPVRCSTLRWCLKEETSLVVVSRRRMHAALSYILIADLPKWCLMQVPSIRVLKRLSTS